MTPIHFNIIRNWDVLTGGEKYHIWSNVGNHIENNVTNNVLETLRSNILKGFNSRFYTSKQLEDAFSILSNL